MSNAIAKFRSGIAATALIGAMAVTSACTSDRDYDENGHMRNQAGLSSSGLYSKNSYRDPNPSYEPSDDMRGARDNNSHDDARDDSRYYPRTAQERQDRIEERIANLHDALDITPAQEAQWNEVADIMRDNEMATFRLLRDHMANRNSRNAIEDFKSYERVASSHVQGMRSLIPAFEVLYNSMSPDQQENADRVFNTYKGQWEKTMPGGHMKGKHNSDNFKLYKSVK